MRQVLLRKDNYLKDEGHGYFDKINLMKLITNSRKHKGSLIFICKTIHKRFFYIGEMLMISDGRKKVKKKRRNVNIYGRGS